MQLKNAFIDDFPGIIISYGDTPSCALIEDFSGIDEIRPGNFVYFDVMQSNLGSCTTRDIAVAVACPVVATHAERNELVIYGGAVHLSKEYILDKDDHRNYGLIVEMDRNGWSDPIQGAYVASLSQEHGIIHMPNPMFSKYNPGSTIGILPVHSCLTANLLKDDTFFCKFFASFELNTEVLFSFTFIILITWFQYHSCILFPINNNFQWLFKADMPYGIILKNSLLAVKKINVIITIVNKRIDGKISHPERGQVLEKVGSLTGVDPVFFNTRFNDQSCI